LVFRVFMKQISIIENLNKHFDSRIRTGVLILLSRKDWTSYSDIKLNLQATDGNLSSHIKGLHQHKYIKTKRTFAGVRPKTFYALTDPY